MLCWIHLPAYDAGNSGPICLRLSPTSIPSLYAGFTPVWSIARGRLHLFRDGFGVLIPISPLSSPWGDFS